ncbi:MAG: glycoside hydrolase family 1 protein [Candidatus Omnitrophota bacterium]
MKNFPKNFLWGAATSSHQVEGDNFYNNWWRWENFEKTVERSGKACDHYRLFEQDFDLARELNHNAHRFSVEWSRIYPKADEFKSDEVEHYLKVVAALRKRNIEPVVTLHHFTNPHWLLDFGGWANPKAVRYFVEYVEHIVKALGADVKYWVTINEPMIYVYYSFIIGIWPPGVKSTREAFKVLNNLILAHSNAYKVIHRIYEENKWPRPYVSIAQNILAFTPCRNFFLDKEAAYLRDQVYNQLLLKVFTTGQMKIPGLIYDRLSFAKETLDFIGLNYYSRHFVRFDLFKPGELFGRQCSLDHHKAGRLNEMNSEVYPEGLLKVLLSLKKYNLPIIITENGTAETDDNFRWQFIKGHLKYLSRAINAGVDVRGYLYWSLLDNFEWHHGFKPRFGLTEVDYATQERKIRESARKFAQVCKSNSIEELT